MTYATPLQTATAQRTDDAAPLTVLRRALPVAVRSIEADRNVALEGARREAVIGVVSGLVRCFRVTPDGRRHIVRFVRAGELICLGAHGTYRNSAETVTASSIVIFPARTLEACAERDASVRQAILQAMTAEIAARDRTQFRLGRLWADERVADFLVELSEQSNKQAARSIAINMSRADIADHLGITLETVSRALHRFQKLGLVDLTGARSFTILRSLALRGFAAGDGDRRPQAAKGTSRDRSGQTMCAA